MTFSITIFSVVYASGEYGPRVLRNFMSDVGNQFTLGTFIATFLYCLMVLRAVRVAGEIGASSSIGAFVPHLSVAVALILAVAGIAVLIYFIHHVPHSIHVSNLIAEIGRELRSNIEKVFPEQIGDAAPPDAARASEIPTDGSKSTCVVSVLTGYIENVDVEGLVTVGRDKDLLLRVENRPGDFVSGGDMLVEAWPCERVDEAR